MNTLDPWQELLKGLELADKIETERPPRIKEYRLYYNEDGAIIGLWETDHPQGNYIVLDDPDLYHRTNTNLLRVLKNKLTVIDPTPVNARQLYLSDKGYKVVKGHAALILDNEEYPTVEYYDRKNN